MSADEYVPDEQDLEVAWIESEASADDINVASAEFHAAMARVRRDAAWEALDGLAAEVRLEWHERHHWLLQPIDDYRNDRYPEESP